MKLCEPNILIGTFTVTAIGDSRLVRYLAYVLGVSNKINFNNYDTFKTK
jgi:hypothetical protein